MARLRPLDVLPSIKLKLSAIIIGAIGIATLVSTIGFRLGWPVWIRPVISGVIGVGIMWLFASGIVSPLRQMAAAATRMARGDYGASVTATSADEVGDLARAFNAMALQLEEVDRERRDLIAMVSHELRTPITALQANLENIVDGVSEADDVLLATMLTQTERLGRLVAQLLDLSRLESGATPLTLESIDLASLVREASQETALHRPDQRIEIEITPPDLTVTADRERLHQVLANLLDNATRFSPAGEPVLVRAAVHGDDVRIEVIDTGPGIPEGDAVRIFERYQRGSHARSTESGGTGLGLAIAQWVVELHAGTITAEPHDPQGCRIEIDLPRNGQSRPLGKQ
ncbi:MAG: signal transduction histidine kinase [Candidatus Aldehydirespiratoraceae bacterium]|jgi:signal transduction histidine kinase